VKPLKHSGRETPKDVAHNNLARSCIVDRNLDPSNPVQMTRIQCAGILRVPKEYVRDHLYNAILPAEDFKACLATGVASQQLKRRGVLDPLGSGI
jgi:hypothetical protein